MATLPHHSRRSSSYSSRRPATTQEVYSYALRVAFLSYLLQPRARRLQHIPAVKQLHRSSTSVTDLVKDFSLIRDNKSTKFPHGFMKELDKRLTGVLVGKEKMPEYSDPQVKSTFAGFLNEFKDPKFRKTMEENRRMEDLLLIFFSNATKIMQRGKAPDDDSWRLMVDRHVALFIRLISSTLRNHDWSRERPELASRLTTMEKKLLTHDQDLVAASQRNGGAGGSTVEVEVPRSYEAKDMPLVLVVSRIFSVPYDTVQQEINAKKDVWSEKDALHDLKAYQTNLSLNTRQTISPNDFDTDAAYDAWRKSEAQDLSQMMLTIIQSSPELAKGSGGALPQFRPDRGSITDSGYADMSRKMSEASDPGSYVIDQPVDVQSLTLNDVPSPVEDDSAPYTYIPPDPRAFYRAVVKQALAYDLQDRDQDPASPAAETQSINLLSKDSIELLSEIGLRWRVPQSSRLVLFLDVAKEKYLHGDIDLQTLEAAFVFAKQPTCENSRKGNRSSVIMLQHAAMFDHTKWTIADYFLKRQILSALHERLRRELEELMLSCYNVKPPSIGQVMYVLNNCIYDDPLFIRNDEDFDAFSAKLSGALGKRAAEVYSNLLAKKIPDIKDQWQFFHIVDLGAEVMKLCEKIQKRYRRNPEVMGVNPLDVLVQEILPSYAVDARDMAVKIMELCQQKDEQVPIPDGFDLYKKLVEIRRVHADALPDQPFAFPIEDLLQVFVWRWIEMTNQHLVQWVENAVKQDPFQVRVSAPDRIPTDDERHSDSVVDIFRSFTQSTDQIRNLEWNDELQNASFMTAISKVIGDALARYCEMLETRFGKEMERLTPEQEATARQTRQEKWLQMAKDTWYNKDKIEPYQFLPESLVKLNNIEYATQKLDGLERAVNVDALAEIIKKHAPPSSQRQKMTKYVFTIKIIEAEDLKACDMNGLSDPYVVLGDEYQKRLAKTRVVYGSLNPRWEETVDITTSGPLNIIATIWDWDTLGDHDCVGRTSLKLDPSHFRDFMPREYWLDLDTQGRILLRVSMEGEKDDIQFYFGKAFRTLKRTERDMTRKITDKLSSYIHYCLSRRALKALLTRGVTVSAVASYFRARPQSIQQGPSQADVMNALQPLFGYFNDNFALMKETLTDNAMVMVMSRLWKEVLATLESLLVPPLSDKPSQQRALTQQELDIVFKWLQLLFDFFHAVDEETGIGSGVPLDILKSPKYHDLQNLNFFYFESTENLVRTSEAMAAASLQKQQEKAARSNRLSAPVYLNGPPTGHSFGGAAGLVGMPTRKHKTVMLSRNLGTMRMAKEEKRKEAQAEPSDDIILRILRMRPEAERYLRDRSRQKERLAAAAAAEMIVKQSMLASNLRR